MQGSNTPYGKGGRSVDPNGVTGRPVTFRQFNSSGSRETATMFPAPTPWYMAITRSASTRVVPE